MPEPHHYVAGLAVGYRLLGTGRVKPLLGKLCGHKHANAERAEECLAKMKQKAKYWKHGRVFPVDVDGIAIVEQLRLANGPRSKSKRS
jgi:hypothetical protein